MSFKEHKNEKDIELSKEFLVSEKSRNIMQDMIMQ